MNIIIVIIINIISIIMFFFLIIIVIAGRAYLPALAKQGFFKRRGGKLGEWNFRKTDHENGIFGNVTLKFCSGVTLVRIEVTYETKNLCYNFSACNTQKVRTTYFMIIGIQN